MRATGAVQGPRTRTPSKALSWNHLPSVADHATASSSLGDHLCAQQQIDFAGMETCEQALEIVTATHRVAIHAANAGCRKDFGQALLALLGARAKVVEVLRVALRAASRHRAPIAAVVAL